MCGRFTLTVDADSIQMHFPWLKDIPSQIVPRYNIAPTQPIAVVSSSNPEAVTHMVWGLIPFWAKDPKIGSPMINARAETLAEKPSFRNAYKRRRCLILADGFFEWVKQPGEKAKTPYFIHMENGSPFAFAGLWEEWHSPDSSQLQSATIITTEPNDLVAPLHNRMPVILPEDSYQDWLAPGEIASAELQPLLKPYPADGMEAYPVSKLVNSPANDRPEAIHPV
jgi:putative SOS response-associated peptidase YedK